MSLLEILATAVINAISGILENIAWFILIIWGVRKMVKETPTWLSIYHKNRLEELMTERALKLK